MGFVQRITESGKAIRAMLAVAFSLVIFLVILGNLSGNLGFTSGSQGEADTEGVILNFTSGALTFATYAPTIFTALAIVLLIAVFLILYQYVGGKKGGSGGFAE